MKMHLEVYRRRPDVKAVVHAHPPVATAFAVAGQVFKKITLPEVIFSIGFVSLADYGTPTTDEVPFSVAKQIGHSDAILLANHGALTVGSDLFDAYYKMETLEHFARITMYARLLGGEKVLSDDQVKDLLRIREDVYGRPPVNLEANPELYAAASAASAASAVAAAGTADVNSVSGDVNSVSGDDTKRLKDIICRAVHEEFEKLKA